MYFDIKQYDTLKPDNSDFPTKIALSAGELLS